MFILEVVENVQIFRFEQMKDLIELSRCIYTEILNILATLAVYTYCMFLLALNVMEILNGDLR